MTSKQHLPIFDFLPIGRENAVSRADIGKTFGLNDREVRREVERERALGALILSSSTPPGGYWRAGPCDEGELRAFCVEMTGRACKILRAASYAGHAAQDMRQAESDFLEG